MKKRPLCLIAVLLTAGIVLARWMGISWIWRSPGGSAPEKMAEEECCVSAGGTVYHQEEKIFAGQTYTYLYLKHTGLYINSKKYPIRNLKCIMKKESPLLLGNRLRVSGKLTLPELPGNHGEFHKREYERSKKIDFYLEEAAVETIEGKRGKLAGFFEKLRERCSRILEKIFPGREAGIMEAMLLGEKSQLDAEVKGFYQAAGISHTIAISGLHISLLGMAVWSILKHLGMPLLLSSGLSFGLLTGYGVLIGNPTTAFRALLMFGMMMGAKILGRAYDLLSALAAAGILLLLDNPDLVCNCGFQLSFLAVVGMGWCGQVQKKLRKYRKEEEEWKKFRREKKEKHRWRRKRKRRGPGVHGEGQVGKMIQNVKENLVTGILLWFFTLPVVLFSFYQVSFTGILCNLLVLPLMPGVLGSGALALVLGRWDTGLGNVAGIPACVILHLYEWMGRAAEKVPFGVWTPGKPSAVTVGVYYAVMAAAWRLCKNAMEETEKNHKKCTAGILCGTALILLTLMAEPWRTREQITVLDVGQGDGIVVQSGGAQVMIDGGSSSRSNPGTCVILPYLKHQGISRLTAVFLTHTDADHINGVQEVLEEAKKGWLTIDYLFMPEWMEETEAGKTMIRTAELSGVTCGTLKKGDRVQVGKMKIKILHPGNEDFSQKPNEGSLVLELETSGIRGVFTGDLPVEEETGILEQISECDFLKAGHHGSDGSSSCELLDRVQPEISLISCGKNNRYGHPGRETLERLEQAGSRIFRTDRQGALILKKTKKGWAVTGYKISLAQSLAERYTEEKEMRRRT